MFKATAPSVQAVSLRAGKHLQLSYIPKSANHKEATNYRPISLLSTLSKMLERHSYQYITNHLNDHHPLSNKQWIKKYTFKENNVCMCPTAI